MCFFFQTKDSPNKLVKPTESTNFSSCSQSRKLTIITMNTNGPTKKGGKFKERRKKVVTKIVHKYKPHIVLFQEPFLGMSELLLPDGYNFEFWEALPICYDDNQVEILKIGRKDLRKNNSFFSDHSSRLHIVDVVTQNSGPKFKFTCISWHGPSYEQSGETKNNLFEELMRFVTEVKQDANPLLLGGDFNLDKESAKQLVKHPFKLHDYIASKRREKKVIDYFVASEDLELSDIEFIDLEKNCEEKSPNELFDHDPIIASLDCNSLNTKKQTQIQNTDHTA